MHRLKHELRNHNKLVKASETKLQRCKMALHTADQQMGLTADSLEQAKQHYEVLTEAATRYLKRPDICPMRMHNYYQEMDAKSKLLEQKERAHKDAQKIRQLALDSYLDAMKKNEFWQDKQQEAALMLGNLRQKRLDMALTEIYNKNKRGNL